MLLVSTAQEVSLSKSSGLVEVGQRQTDRAIGGFERLRAKKRSAHCESMFRCWRKGSA